jgi:hypothetical protein
LGKENQPVWNTIKIYFSIFPVDITTCFRGFHGDLNETFFVGEVDEKTKNLVKVTHECLAKAIDAGKWENTYIVHANSIVISPNYKIYLNVFVLHFTTGIQFGTILYMKLNLEISNNEIHVTRYYCHGMS